MLGYRKQRAAIVKSQKMKLGTLDFTDHSLNDFETCKAVVTIFTELDMVNRFKIDSHVSKTGSFMSHFYRLFQLGSLNVDECCLYV